MHIHICIYVYTYSILCHPISSWAVKGNRTYVRLCNVVEEWYNVAEFIVLTSSNEVSYMYVYYLVKKTCILQH